MTASNEKLARVQSKKISSEKVRAAAADKAGPAEVEVAQAYHRL